jgi:hypothetical protein
VDGEEEMFWFLALSWIIGILVVGAIIKLTG